LFGTGTGGGIINLFGLSRFVNSGNGFAVLNNSTTGIFTTINLFDNAFVDGYTVQIIDPTSTLNINTNGSAALYDGYQPISATVNYTGANLIGGFTVAPVGAIPTKTSDRTTSWLLFPQIVEKGTATLAAGTATVTTVITFTGTEHIMVTRNTPSGANLGILSAPSASRTGTSFVINADRLIFPGLETDDTSTVDWIIIR
jgi:hypothetical protein